MRQRIAAFFVELPAFAPGSGAFVITPDDLEHALEAGEEWRRLGAKVDQYVDRAAVLARVVDDDRRLRGMRRGQVDVRQEPLRASSQFVQRRGGGGIGVTAPAALLHKPSPASRSPTADWQRQVEADFGHCFSEQ